MTDSLIYTIGYGARDIADFIAVLRRYEVSYLIDVRSRPYSRYKPDFSRETLEGHLRSAGIRYVYMGDSLGGLPADRTCYGDDGKVLYEQVMEREFFHAGIERLAAAHIQGLAICLMCSEGKPEICHRTKLIGPTLIGRGLPVMHIDESDALITQADVGLRRTGNQLSLFSDETLPGTSRRRYDFDEMYGAEDEPE